MNHRTVQPTPGVLFFVVLFCALVAGCFKENPAYNKKDSGASADLPLWDGAGLDGVADLGDGDDIFSPDVVPWPDVQAWPCTTDAQCKDTHDCTEDRCTGGKCTHSLVPHRCLIGLKCYKTGQFPPGNNCVICDAAKSTSIWTTRADGSGCLSDNKSCTTDACAAGKCQHKLKAKQCLIGGKCYALAQKNPSNSCQVCDSTQKTSGWTTEQDKMPCQKDGLGCTSDYCLKGKCAHPVASGCVISGACVGENEASPTDKCKVCVSGVSKTAYSSAVGAPCSPGSGKPGMCSAANTCVGFNQKLYTAKGAYHTSLNAVDYIPAAKGVWAAGMYQETDKGSAKGVLVQATASSSASEVLTANALSDLHYRMAVGQKGTVMYHDGKSWTAATWLAKPLGTADRLSVWGANVNNTLTFFLTAKQSSTVAAVTRCTLGASIVCEGHTGVASGAGLGRIVGTLTSGGGQGPLWAAVMGAYTDPEDIYHNTGKTKTWSTSGPNGCKDGSGTPCSNTSAETYDLEGSSASDLWLVGSNGLILRHDGKSWSKQTNVIPSQSYYHFTAVYSSAKDKLTTVVGHYDSASSKVRRLRMFNYNHTLKRWFGPITIAETPYQSPDLILDVGGQGYSELWMVGQRKIVNTSGKPQLAGWMLQLK